MIRQCGIIGYGKLGSALAESLGSQGRLSWIYTKPHHPTMITASKLGVPVIHSFYELPHTDCIIIAVPDSSISSIITLLSEHCVNQLETMLLHCSGVLGMEVFNEAHEQFPITACAHPFQTIMQSSSLADIPWGIECNKEQEALISEFITSIQGMPIVLSEYTRHNKAQYHATAVIASNFMTILAELSAMSAHMSGIDPAIFLPLIQSTALKNAQESIATGKSALEMLTGPLKRADIETLALHCNALKANPIIHDLYVNMSKVALELLLENKSISNDHFVAMYSILSTKE